MKNTDIPATAQLFQKPCGQLLSNTERQLAEDFEFLGIQRHNWRHF